MSLPSIGVDQTPVGDQYTWTAQPGTLLWMGTDGRLYWLSESGHLAPPPGPEGFQRALAVAACKFYAEDAR